MLKVQFLLTEKTVCALQRRSVAAVRGSDWLCEYVQHQLVSFFM